MQKIIKSNFFYSQFPIQNSKLPTFLWLTRRSHLYHIRPKIRPPQSLSLSLSLSLSQTAEKANRRKVCVYQVKFLGRPRFSSFLHVRARALYIHIRDKSRSSGDGLEDFRCAESLRRKVQRRRRAREREKDNAELIIDIISEWERDVRVWSCGFGSC